MDREQRILPVIFISSSASLAFEVLLTRIYSIAVSYHFAAMIVSIAMLGLAAGGVLLSLFPGLRSPGHIGRYALALGIAIPVSFLLVNRFPFDPVRLSWEKTEILRIGFHYLVLAVPFLCAGLVIATAFAARSGQAGLIYGADLLGAGTGSVGILVLTSLTSPERGIFLLCAIVLAASCMLLAAPLRTAAVVLSLASVTLFLLQPEFGKLRISPYKGLEAALRYPGASPMRSYYSSSARVDTFRSPAVRFAPGLSLKYLEPLPEQTGIAVDGGDISAVTDASAPAGLAFLSFLPAALPYEAGIRGRVLVLDPKGGLHLLLAQRYGAGDALGIESTPLLARVTRELGAASPGERPARILTGSGRSWLMGGEETFDLIDLPLQGASPSAAFGMAEEYRLTVEAVREYLSHLRPGGALCVNLFLLPPPRIELRILATAATALEELGVRDAAGHIAVVRSWGSMSILVKRSPLSRAEVERIRRFARDRWFDLVSLPGLAAEESNVFVRLPSDEYFRACSAVLSPGKRERFMDGYLFDVKPVRDDAPFFNHFLRLGNIRETYRVMGGKWQFFLEEGYLFPAILFQALLLSGLLMLVPALARTRNGARAASAASPVEASLVGRAGNTVLRVRHFLPYFALIGIGFMFAEIFLIQKLILPLGNATYALAAVLAALLAGSGAGSLLSQRLDVLRRPFIAAAAALLIIIYSLLLPTATTMLAALTPLLRFAAVFIALLPLGLPMGIPFPLGMRLLGERDPSLIPWAWVINGSFSVLAPVMALMLALMTGFDMVAYLAAAAYVFAFLILARTQSSS
ncbi:class I SAM-dependent methyltransferase [bacterium]|nr:class I SAM-dependent methyltransferase [bacterium]